MVMRLTLDQLRADRARMEQFICERIPGGVTRIDLGNGAWADLTSFWDDRFRWGLLIESNEPEWVGLWEVYQHFWRKEMTAREWSQEFDGEFARWKVHDLEKENCAMGYELNQLRQTTLEPQMRSDAAIPLIQALPDLTSIAKSLARIADVVDPPPSKIVDPPYVANRLDCTTVWVAEMARNGQIPKNCIVPGTGNGKLWKFYRSLIDQWIESR